MILTSYLGDYRSLSGAHIKRDCPVRLVYLDEAGVSNPIQEPYLVVSGVILNGDQDWRPLERHIKSLIRKHIPERDREGFIFHAMDVWHGSRYFDRQKWPLSTRRNILSDLAKIPNQFHLTVVNGFVHRLSAADHLRQQNLRDSTIANIIHADAFISVVRAIDTWMKHNAPREVAMIVAENTGKMQAALKDLQHGYGSDLMDEYWIDKIHF